MKQEVTGLLPEGLQKVKLMKAWSFEDFTRTFDNSSK